MKFASMLSVFALCIASTQATAADFYLSVNVAKVFANTQSDDFNLNVDAEDAYGGGIGAGWDFASGVQLEINIDGAEGQSEATGADVAIGKLSFNIGYGPHIAQFQPLVGFRLGVAAIDVEGSAFDPEAGVLIGGNLGGFFWVNDHFGLGPEYSYEYTDARVDGINDSETTLHNVKLKVMFKF